MPKYLPAHVESQQNEGEASMFYICMHMQIHMYVDMIPKKDLHVCVFTYNVAIDAFGASLQKT